MVGFLHIRDLQPGLVLAYRHLADNHCAVSGTIMLIAGIDLRDQPFIVSARGILAGVFRAPVETDGASEKGV